MTKSAYLSLYRVAAMAALCSAFCATTARASTTTDIAIAYTGGLYSNWSNAINGNQIAAAPKNGNTNTGITFGDWSGQFNQINSGQTTVFAIPNVVLGTTSTVNSLFNTFYGDSNIDAVLTFQNSLGATAIYDFTGGQSIRDYNQNSYQNVLGQADPGVSAENWWNNGGNGQRLDVQSLALPTSWAGTNLVSLTVTNPNTDGTEDVFSALQVVTSTTSVVTATPEPSSIALLGTGALGLAGMVRRRIARKN